jgi:copper homeostasis protein
MRSSTLVEIVVDSVAGARAAAEGGADRLELCIGLAEGGLTPSLGLLQEVKAAVALPVMAMVRPRGGDFLYDADEFAILQRDAEALLAAGADGLVSGMLAADGTLDRSRMARLRAIAGARPTTCHRAFDVTRDPRRTLEELIDLGIQRVLTSGQRSSALLGEALIAQLVEQAAGRITILAGGGLRAQNITAFLARTGVCEVHLSASGFRPSSMQFRNPEVPMGCSLPADEYTLRCTDVAEVRSVVDALRHGSHRPLDSR